jgi:hypothetical protein
LTGFVLRQNELVQVKRKEKEMSEQVQTVVPAKQRGFSIDSWAVLLAFTLAALVRAGVFKHIPW